jgi:hypothetical protein
MAVDNLVIQSRSIPYKVNQICTGAGCFAATDTSRQRVRAPQFLWRFAQVFVVA